MQPQVVKSMLALGVPVKYLFSYMWEEDYEEQEMGVILNGIDYPDGRTECLQEIIGIYTEMGRGLRQ